MVASMLWEGTNEEAYAVLLLMEGLSLVVSHTVVSIEQRTSSVTPSTTTESPQVVDTAMR